MEFQTTVETRTCCTFPLPLVNILQGFCNFFPITVSSLVSVNNSILNPYTPNPIFCLKIADFFHRSKKENHFW